jgi:hypothetical protein
MTALPRLASTRPLPGTGIDASAWLTLAWSGVAVFGGGLGALVVLGRWDEVMIAACFLLPLLLVMLMRHGLPNLLVAAISLCFLISGAGWAWDWYGLFWWFDVVLHALNPLVMVAGSMFMLWKAGLLRHAPRKGLFVLEATALGFVLGVAWEGFEFTYLPLTWPDTILDVVMDTAGAALGGWWAVWMIDRRGLAPVGRRPRPSTWSAQPVPVPIPAPTRAR